MPEQFNKPFEVMRHREKDSPGEPTEKGMVFEHKQTWPQTDYIEDVPEAVVRGKELVEKAKALAEEDKLEEALSVLTEDKFAAAAYLALQAQKNAKGSIWVPIKVEAVIEKYRDDKNIVPRRPKNKGGGISSVFQGGGRYIGQQTPYAPWVQKMYAKDRPNHPGKEMATFTGDERLHDYINQLEARIREKKRQHLQKEQEIFLQEHQGNLQAAIDFYNERKAGKRPLLEVDKTGQGYRPDASEGWKADARWVDAYRRHFTIQHVADLFGVDYESLLKAVRKKPDEK